MDNSMKNQAQDDQSENGENISPEILPASDCGSNFNSNSEAMEVDNCEDMNQITTSMNDLHDSEVNVENDTSEVHVENDTSELPMLETIKTEPISEPSSPEHVANDEVNVSEIPMIETIKTEPISAPSSPGHVANDEAGVSGLSEAIKTEPDSVPNSPVGEPQAKPKVKLLYITRPIKLEMPSPIASPEREQEFDDEDTESFAPCIESPPISVQLSNEHEVNQGQSSSFGNNEISGSFLITPIVLPLNLFENTVRKYKKEYIKKNEESDHKDKAVIDDKRQNSNNDSKKVEVTKNDNNSILHHERLNSGRDDNSSFSSDDLSGDRKDKTY